MEQLMEGGLTRKTEVPGENLLQCHFVHHKSHMGLNPGPCDGKPATSYLSYGMASTH
jgi:hypothetical protein